MTKAVKFAPEERLALRPPEAAKLLGVGLTTIYALMKSGAVPCKKLGGATIIAHADLRKYIDSLPSGR